MLDCGVSAELWQITSKISPCGPGNHRGGATEGPLD